jgi:hypothetical protein
VLNRRANAVCHARAVKKLHQPRGRLGEHHPLRPATLRIFYPQTPHRLVPNCHSALYVKQHKVEVLDHNHPHSLPSCDAKRRPTVACVRGRVLKQRSGALSSRASDGGLTRSAAAIGAMVMLAMVVTASTVEAGCSPPAGAGTPTSGTTVTCSGTATNQNAPTGYGDGSQNGLTINVLNGAFVVGTVNGFALDGSIHR